ncbi:MAG: CoB--CoM heterodisulfide reductase subunit B [Methanomassiliicoccales archaeon]|nr:CoB--CoM heterodisulfide reductase subunit B [Methanomassiliicoccales archaeon]
MSYALFPGCIARNMYPSIEKSTRMVFKELGLEMVEVKFTCCPAPGVIRSYDFDSWLVIAARNLAAAEEKGADLITICNGCYGTLEAAHKHLSKHPESVAMVNAKLSGIDMRYGGASKVVHFVDVLDTMLPQIAEKIKVELGLRVAIHYGCHYLKPSCDSGRNVESPEVLERIVRALGCESVDFPEKLSCCGAGGGVWSGDEKVSLGILDRKMRFIKESGADCILDICPFCHLQLDQGQKRLKNRYDVPVLHLNQLIGLSFGIKDKVLGVHTHMVATRDIAKKAKKARMNLEAET